MISVLEYPTRGGIANVLLSHNSKIYSIHYILVTFFFRHQHDMVKDL